jgi:hypothetical protein
MWTRSTAPEQLREPSRCRRMHERLPPSLASPRHPLRAVDWHATPANEGRTDHQTFALVSAVIGALGRLRLHVLYDPTSRQG